MGQWRPRKDRMSRIILATYPNGEQKFVVGWDRPLATFYWQHFNKEPEPDQSGEVDWDDWEEMAAFKGYIPSELPTVKALWDSCPPKIQDLVTFEVQELLEKHAMDPNTGSVIVDLTKQQEA